MRKIIIPILPFMMLVGASSLRAADTTCADHSIVASAIRTPSDLRAFVQCAYEFAQEVGTEEARRAFHADERWKSGPIYVFVDTLTPIGAESTAIVYPPDPSLEGQAWGLLVDNFGSDLLEEFYRVAHDFGRGWVYYAFWNPVTRIEEPKTSYIMAIDWDGTEAAIGAGIYRRDLPGTCHSEEVNAAALAAEPSSARLEEFVRCAAYRVEALGYFATPELTKDPRWSSEAIYVFGLDLWGTQLFSGSPLQRRRTALHEWGESDSPLEQFGGRDMAGVAEAFEETYLYYDAVHPVTGQTQRKIAFVKRVSALGVPVLVGAGLYLDDAAEAGEMTAEQ